MESALSWLSPAVLESIQDGYVFLDREMRYVYVNTATLKLLGKTREELLGRYVWDVFPAPPSSPFRAAIDRAAATGQPTHVDGLNMSLGVWFDVYSYPSEEGLSILFREVTHQKRAEEQLRELSEQRRLALDVAELGTWRFEIRSGEMIWDERGRAINGITKGEGIPISEAPNVVHPDDLATVEKAFQDTLDPARRAPYRVEHRVVWPDGSVHWVAAHGVAVFDGEGLDAEPLRVLGTVMDVTAQKQTEAALRDSEARFRTMADAAPVLIWLAGPDRRRTFFNRGWLDFTGHRLEADLGEGWTQSVHPGDHDRFVELYNVSFETRRAFTTEYRLRRHDGEYRWILARGTPLYNGTGAFTGFIGTCADIHERRVAEDRVLFLARAGEALSSSLDFETTLAQVAGLVVPRLADWFAIELLTDEGTPERVLTKHVDPAKVAMAEELRQRFPVDLDSPSGLGWVIRSGQPEFAPVVTDEMLIAAIQDEAYLRLILSIGLSSVIIVPLKTPQRTLGAMTMIWSESGNHYTEEDLRFAQELAGRAAAAIENAQLYRKARSAEEGLRALNETLEMRVQERTAALAERNADLQSFASAASHDLQEPLRKVRTFLELLKAEIPDLNPEAEGYMERIDAAAGRMSQFITDLLALSRVATRGETFRRTDLNAVLDEVLSDLEIRIAETGARIDIGELGAVDADPLQMRQLFQNLIGNALKFRRSDATPHVRISSRSEGEAGASRLYVSVQDNGIGFDQKYADRIFQPFQRLHGKAEYPGSGMGLAIVRRIVERHRGSIAARSEPGVGTTFSVVLPVEQGETAARADA